VPRDAVPSDRELAGAAQRGDRPAFDALVDRHARRLLHFLRMRAPSAGAAEELVQDTFVQCWQTLRRYDPSRSFSTWLYKLASNLASSEGRRRRRSAGPPLEEPAAGPDPAREACARDASANIWDTVHAALPSDARTALWLFYGEARTAADVGEILGRSEGAVRVLLSRARTRLAALLPKDALSSETR